MQNHYDFTSDTHAQNQSAKAFQQRIMNVEGVVSTGTTLGSGEHTVILRGDVGRAELPGGFRGVLERFGLGIDSHEHSESEYSGPGQTVVELSPNDPDKEGAN